MTEDIASPQVAEAREAREIASEPVTADTAEMPKEEPAEPKLYAGKYKSDAELEKAYMHLQSKLGALKGAPEDYQIEGYRGDPNSLLLQEMKAWGKEVGVDQDGFNKLLGRMAAAADTDNQRRSEQELSSLGADAHALIERVENWAHSSFEESEIETLKGMVTTAAEYKLLDKLRANFKSSPKPGTSMSGVNFESMADIDAERSQKANMERYNNNTGGYRDAVLKRKADAAERTGDNKAAARYRFLAGKK